MNQENILNDQNIENWPKKDWPIGLTEIPQPPKKLYIRGKIPIGKKFLCIVGPRKHSSYAENVCQNLIAELAGYPICIVSGLAYGIDAIAHGTALEHGIDTISFPGSGLSEKVIYPAANVNLARKIIEKGGALISEFSSDFKIQRWMFHQRNRLMVGISDAVLIIEANRKSGTIITANLAIEYDRELAIVPGAIYNQNSLGSNDLIKEGAYVITCAEDILDILKIKSNAKQKNIAYLSEIEQNFLKQLSEPKEIEALKEELGLSINQINEIISRLEIKNLIKVINGKICQI